MAARNKSPDLGTTQFHLNRFNSSCESFELILLLTQVAFTEVESVQLMTQVVFKGIDSIQLMIQTIPENIDSNQLKAQVYETFDLNLLINQL